MGQSYLFNAVPVGLGQVEAAGSRTRLIAHHTEFGQRGEALSSSRHAVLPGVKQTPIIPRWCYNDNSSVEHSLSYVIFYYILSDCVNSILTCGHVVIYPLDRYSSVCNRVPLLIFHNPSNAAMHLKYTNSYMSERSKVQGTVAE